MKDDKFCRLKATGAGAQAPPPAIRRAAEASLLGRALREVRRQRGWSQKSLAHRLGISESYLGQIELGKRLPSAHLCVKMREWIENPATTPRCAAQDAFSPGVPNVSDEEVNRVVRALLATMDND